MDGAPMSVQAMAWVFDHSPTKGTDRLVLLSLANHAGPSPEDGAWESWPGVALIAHEAGTGRERTVQDSLSRLCEEGHLERIVNGAPDRRIPADRRPNLYRILLANGASCGDDRCRWCDRHGVTDGDTPQQGDGVTDHAERGDGSRPDGVTDGVTQTIMEPSSEPPPPSSSGSTTPAVEEAGQEQGVSAETLAAAACDLVGEHNHKNTRGHIRVPEAHLAACQTAARARHWPAALEMAEKHPGWSAIDISKAIIGSGIVGLNAMGADTAQAAARALAERTAERLAADRDAPPPDPAAVAAARAEAREALKRTRPKDPDQG